MRILQICNKPPYPPQDGGSIGMNNVTQGLIEAGHKVKIISVNPPKHHVNLKELPSEYVRNTDIELVYIDTEIKPVNALLNLFTRNSYHIERFISSDFNEKLTDILRNGTFDIIQIESIFLMGYLKTLRKHSTSKVVLRAPNIEFRIWERMTSQAKNPLKKIYLAMLTRRLRKWELEQINRADAVYTVTSNDMDFFKENGCIKPITYIPTGIDMTKKVDLDFSHVEFPSLFHIGALDWLPNQEAIQWFLKNVWNKVHTNFPDLKLFLAGRNTPQWIFNLNMPNVEVLGEVKDAGEFIASKSVMLVPLMSGSGMRVKIIEGMMLGKTIITTTIGIEGIIHKNNENVLIANTPEEFYDSIVRCINNRPFSEKIGRNAHLNAKANYDNVVLTQKLVGFFTDLLKVP
jgi:polysaccharide biosynthesis protein PslH